MTPEERIAILKAANDEIITLRRQNAALQKEADHWREAYISAHNLGAELKEELAALRARLAQQWTPCVDGIVHREAITDKIEYQITLDEDQIDAYYVNLLSGHRNQVAVTLPPTKRLCERTQPAEVQP